MLTLNKNVELKASFEWIKNAFLIFRENPLQFISLSLCTALTALLPLFGSFMAPLFTAQFARLANLTEDRRKIYFSDLFKGFFSNPGVRTIALVNFAVAVILMGMQYILEGYKLSDNQVVTANIHMIILVIPVLLMQMAIWLAPIICIYNDAISPREAIKLSFKASLTNIPTLLLYSILLIAFTLLSLIPFGLGLLVWLPTANISTYFVYKALYVNQ